MRISVNETISLALDSLKRNKLRTFLTLLGIIIAVSTIIGIIGTIQGLNHYVEEKIIPYGASDFSVNRFSEVITSWEDFLKMSRRKRFPLRYYFRVKELCNTCEKVGATDGTTTNVIYKGKTMEDVRVRGETSLAREITGVRDLYDGRPFTEEESITGAKVATIGWDVKETLFPGIDPIGKRIRIKGTYFRIIGVEAKRGKIMGISQDNYVYIPIKAYYTLFNRKEDITILVHTSSPQRMEAAMEEVRGILRSLRHLSPKQDDDFSFSTSESLLTVYKNLTSTLYIALIIISSISLLVGGIVVMNIMLVSVTERVPEIGVRRAVGARRADIMGQFLIEAVFLTSLGGVIGILLGWLIVFLINKFSPLPARMEIWFTILGLGIAGLTGLIFGIYPASKAASLNPVEALRSEM
ncbi:MAG: ABC transporter permease [Candidatus Aminicenantes bacterium]|nr:ABC transporter permease [Candidatus Aminicenantes bacterium]